MAEATTDFNRRPIIGILSIVLLVTAVVMLLRSAGSENQAFGAACLRVGLLLGAVWLAYPQLERIPAWMFGTLLTALMVMAVRPQMAVLIVPSLLMLWFLRGLSV